MQGIRHDISYQKISTSEGEKYGMAAGLIFPGESFWFEVATVMYKPERILGTLIEDVDITFNKCEKGRRLHMGKPFSWLCAHSVVISALMGPDTRHVGGCY